MITTTPYRLLANAMPIAAADLATLSRLLEEALDLDAPQREAWLAGLPPEHRRHETVLRDMLAAQFSADTASLLSTLPKLSADEATAQAGERVGPYQLLRQIGEGGMGSVWLAARADGNYERQVALKLPRLAWGAGLAERMAREREIGMRLEHPAIARLYDAGVDERGRPYLALEYIDGQPLDAWCKAKGLDTRARLKLFLQVVRAVAYAHGRLVVHRDLKPSNVMVSADGQAHLLDFGIAKLLTEAAPDAPGLTQQQGRLMTPHYASPEQIAGETISVASDIYSLGVLLYEILTGALPMNPKRSTAAAVEDAALQGDAPLASSRARDRSVAKALRGDVDAILGKAMKRQPAERYVSADAMAEDIERHLTGETVKAQPESLAYRLRKALRRHWFGFGATTAVLLAVLVGAGATLLQAQRAAQQGERARLATEFVAEIFRASAGTGAGGKASEATNSDSGGEPLLGNVGALIEVRFEGQADMQAELYGVVGRIYADLGANGPATVYARRQIAVLERMPLDRRRLVSARLLLADAQESDGHVADAEVQAARAVQEAGGDVVLEAEARAFLARIQLQAGKHDLALASAQAAELVLSAPGSPPSIAMAWAVNTRSRLMDAARDFTGMSSLYERSMDLARQADGPDSPALVSMQITWAYRLLATGRRADSAQLLDGVLARLRAQGGAGEARAAIVEATYWAHRYYDGDTVPYVKVVAIIERCRAVLSDRSRLPAEVRAKLDWALGSTHLSHGELDLAGPLLDSAGPLLMTATDHAFTQLAITQTLGTYAMLRGRHEKAEALFRQTLQLRQRYGQSMRQWAANDWALLAINFTMQGKSREARQLLARAPEFGAYNGNPWFSKLLPAIVAMSHFNEGDAAGALDRFPSRDDDDADGYSVFSFQASRGAALCSVGKGSLGLPLLQASMQSIALREGDLHPGLARLRALAGLCALGLGDAQQAQRLARAARATFTAQSDVAGYFEAPLIQLETRLQARRQPLSIAPSSKRALSQSRRTVRSVRSSASAISTSV